MSFTNRSFKWAGVLALVVCAAFAVTGCNLFGGDDDGDDSGPIYLTVRTNLEYQMPASGTMSIVAAPVVDATEVWAVINDGVSNQNVRLNLEAGTGAYVGAYAGSTTGTVKGVLIHARKGELVLRNMVVNPVLNGNVYNCGVTNPTTTAFAQMMLKLTGVEDQGTIAPFTANFFADGLTKKYTVQGAQKTVTELENMFRTSDLFAAYRTYWEKVLALANTSATTGNNIIQRAYQENLVEGKSAGEIDSAYAETIGEWVGVTDFYFNNIRAEIDNKEVVEIVGSEKRAYRSITVNLPSYVPYNGTVNFTFFGQNVTIANVAYTGINNALDLSKPVVLIVNGFPKTAGAVANRIYYLVKAVRSAAAVAVNVANSEELKKALASDAQEIVLTGTEEYYIADEPVQWVTQQAFSANKKIYSNATGAVVVFHGADVAHLINDPDGTNNGTGWQVVKGDDNVKFVLAARKGEDIYNGLTNSNLANPNDNTNTNRIDEIRLLSDCVYNPRATGPLATPQILCSQKVIDLNGKVLTGLNVQLGFISGNQATLTIVSNGGALAGNQRAATLPRAGYLRSATITGKTAPGAAAAIPDFYLGSVVLSDEVVIGEDANNQLTLIDCVQVTVNNVAQLEKVLTANSNSSANNVLKVVLNGAKTYELTKSIAFSANRAGFATPNFYAVMLDLNASSLDLKGWSLDISKNAAAGYALKVYGTGTLSNGTILSTNNANYEVASTVTLGTDAQKIVFPTNVVDAKEYVVTSAAEFKTAVTNKAGIIVVNISGTELDLQTEMPNGVEFSNYTIIYSKNDPVTIKAKKFTAAYNVAKTENYTVQTFTIPGNIIAANAADKTPRGVYLQAIVGTEDELREALGLNLKVKSVANKIYMSTDISLAQTLNVGNVFEVACATGKKLYPAAVTVTPLVKLTGLVKNEITGLTQVLFKDLKLESTAGSEVGTQVLFQNAIAAAQDDAVDYLFDNVNFYAAPTISTGTSRIGYLAGVTGDAKFTKCVFDGFTGNSGIALDFNGVDHDLTGSSGNTFKNSRIAIRGGYDYNFLYVANTVENCFGACSAVADSTMTSSTNAIGLLPSGYTVNFATYTFLYQGADAVDGNGAYWIQSANYTYGAMETVTSGATESGKLGAATNTWTIQGVTLPIYSLKLGYDFSLTGRQIRNSMDSTSVTVKSAVTTEKGDKLVTLDASTGVLKIKSKTPLDVAYGNAKVLIKATLSNDSVYYFQVNIN